MNNYIFPEELDGLTWDGTTGTVTATADGNQVQFTVEGDENDVIEVDGLGDLFQDLSEDNPIHCEIETQVDGDSPSGVGFTLIRSEVQIGETAVSFCARHFLNMQQGTKDTYVGAKERLTIYIEKPVTSGYFKLSLRKTWADVETGEIAETTESVKSETAIFMAGFCGWEFTITDGNAPAEGMQLIEIEASFGERVQRYEVRECRDAAPISILYINNFGVRDTFHFFGGSTRTVQADRESALFNEGKAITRTYAVTRNTETTARTGILREESLRAFEDLCCTRQAWNSEGKEIYIKDNELEYSDAYGSPQQGSITYGESDARAAFSKGKEAETFDGSFDSSFK
jgi:hypothetical protein